MDVFLTEIFLYFSFVMYGTKMMIKLTMFDNVNNCRQSHCFGL